MIPEKLKILTNYKATEYCVNTNYKSIHVNDAFIAGAEFMYSEMSRKLEVAIGALKEIANEDFRGNRPIGSVKAFKALEELEK